MTFEWTSIHQFNGSNKNSKPKTNTYMITTKLNLSRKLTKKVFSHVSFGYQLATFDWGGGSIHCAVHTFSSNALWCSNRLLSAFNTSTSLETPLCAAACRFTTVIRNDRSCRDTKHSRCSNSNYWARETKEQKTNIWMNDIHMNEWIDRVNSRTNKLI